MKKTKKLENTGKSGSTGTAVARERPLVGPGHDLSAIRHIASQGTAKTLTVAAIAGSQSSGQPTPKPTAAPVSGGRPVRRPTPISHLPVSQSRYPPSQKIN